jgi:Transglycosylase SLT domain
MTVFTRIVAISSRIIVASALSLPTAWAEDVAGRTAIPSAVSDPASEALSSPNSAPNSPAGAPSSGQRGKSEYLLPELGDSLCVALRKEALANDLPAGFFIALIQQESRLDPLAQSHVGAQGIAQFMPKTAQWRGLPDPFEPFQALHESARWLHELRHQFGNLGLAAAAYNAGPRRVQDWIRGRAKLPEETKRYVAKITGKSADEWVRVGVVDQTGTTEEDGLSCDTIKFAKSGVSVPLRDRENLDRLGSQAEHASWALQLIGDPSENRAIAEYKTLQRKFSEFLANRPPIVLRNQVGAKGSAYWFRVRISEKTRGSATELCTKLRTRGGSCLVVRN